MRGNFRGKTRKRTARLGVALAAAGLLTLGMGAAQAAYDAVTHTWDGSTANSYSGDIGSATHGYGQANIIDGGAVNVIVRMGDTGAVNNDYTMTSLTLKATGAWSDFYWVEGAGTITGNVTLDAASTSSNSYLSVYASGLTDAVLNVTGSVTDRTNATNSFSVEIDSTPGAGASIMNVEQDLILANSGAGSYVYLNSSNNAAALTVGGNLGSYLALGPDGYPMLAPSNLTTTISVDAGAGDTTQAHNPRFDVNIRANNIYVNALETETASTANIADTHGNVTYEAANDFYAAGVSVLFNSDTTVGGYAQGGDITYRAGNDLALSIDDSANDLETARYVGNFTYEAGRDLKLVYTGGSYTFTGNTSQGGALRMLANRGNIAVDGTFLIDAGAGGAEVIANAANASGAGNISFTGSLGAHVASSGNIAIRGSNPGGSALLTIGGDAEFFSPPSSAATGNIDVTVDNATVGGSALLSSNNSGSINFTAMNAAGSPAFPNLSVVGLAPLQGSMVTIQDSLLVQTTGTAGGSAALSARNLLVFGDVFRDGVDGSTNIQASDLLGLGGDIGSFNANGLSGATKNVTFAPQRLLFLPGGAGITTTSEYTDPTDPYWLAAGINQTAGTHTDNVLVASPVGIVANPQAFGPGVTGDTMLYSWLGMGNTDYAKRVNDGSLHVGALPAGTITGFQVDSLILAPGGYQPAAFTPTRLFIGDRLAMAAGGTMDIQDGAGLVFSYNEIEGLTPTAGGTGNGDGHFTASALNMSGISYTFRNAQALLAEIEAGGPQAAWNQPYHNVVLAMGDPRISYANPTDNLETIGFNPTAFTTNLDNSLFFVVNRDYVPLDATMVGSSEFSGGNTYAAGDKYAYAITSVTRTANTLQSLAPTQALADMAGVLESPNWAGVSGSAGPNPAINYLYLSPDQATYQRDLTQIASGTFLNASFMANHVLHYNNIDRLAEINRQAWRDKQPKPAVATGENAEIPNGMWASLYYGHRSIDDDFGNGVMGFDVDTWGMAAGYDRYINETFSAGVFLGVSRPKLKDNNGGKIDADDFQIGLYGAARLPMLFEFNLALGYGWQSYDANRSVNISRAGLPNLSERLWADYDGDTFDLAAELARPFYFENNWWVRPAIGYHYQYTSLDGYSENSDLYTMSNPSSLAQQVGDTDLSQHFFKIGASGGWSNDRFDLGLKANWVLRAGDDRPSGTATFRALSDRGTFMPFGVEGAEADDSLLYLGLNARAWLNADKTASVGAGYEGLFGSEEQSHVFNLNLRYDF